MNPNGAEMAPSNVHERFEFVECVVLLCVVEIYIRYLLRCEEEDFLYWGLECPVTNGLNNFQDIKQT